MEERGRPATAMATWGDRISPGEEFAFLPQTGDGSRSPSTPAAPKNRHGEVSKIGVARPTSDQVNPKPEV